MLTALRSELAGISSGMARRDSLILGTSVVSGITLRRDSVIGGNTGDSRRGSLILPDIYGRSSIPVMEVEPWELSQSVQEVSFQKIKKCLQSSLSRLLTKCLRDILF